ncbi:DUF927 domain-containing protein [Virgibacillus flavescens]|uniref:DUF927 domain-containing protein n=1 Tax=Virgibacillus flavescens TaxID=1611422 RepID=UPI003D355945
MHALNEKIELRHDTIIDIAEGHYINDVNKKNEAFVSNKKMKYSDLVNKLKQPKIGLKGSNLSFIGGKMEPICTDEDNHILRVKENLIHRSLITIDIDDVPFGVDVWGRIKQYTNFGIVMYSTHRSTSSKPRYRLVVPLKTIVKPIEFEAITRFIVELIDLEIDERSYSITQVMHYPTCEKLANYEFYYRDEPLFNPRNIPGDKIKEYKEMSKYKKTSGEFKKRDPRTKENWIGAWCNVYSITDVLDTFLSHVYERVKGDRYTYLDGSTEGGLVIYDDNCHAYSNHSTDPISSLVVNSFDLYRLHRFGHLDRDEKKMNDKPSYRSMIEHCKQDVEVMAYYEEKIQYKMLEGLQKDLESSVPKPFLVGTGDTLLERKEDKKGNVTTKLVSRKVPYVTKEFRNLERPQVLFEVIWKERNRMVKEVVPASTLAVKKELLELSNKGFSVNDNNTKDLINYFDQYLLLNNIEHHYAVERLGQINDKFIHPVITGDVEIITLDQGEKQLLDSFEVKGTSNGWIHEVFDRISDQPKALFMVLASFASVIIKDLKVPPFIVDLSGTTSQGKTTTLKVAASVWGNESLMSEWNATPISIERKAAYLNSYPLILDDTRKSKDSILQSIIYQFSGGRSKGRASLKGSQKEYTWSNILLSTGEVSLNEYTSNASGAAARVIPLVDEPLRKDYENIMRLHAGLENNYGSIGIDFLKMWVKYKKEAISEYQRIRNQYSSKARNNEVLNRLAGYYASVHLAGSMLEKYLFVDIKLDDLYTLFEDIAQENKAIDKPLQFLKNILIDLDSKRENIYYHLNPQQRGIKAIYKKKQKQLYLMPAYTLEFLGVEEKQTRREWTKRGMTISRDNNGRKVDYKLVSHRGKKFNVIPLNMECVLELGFDFEERDSGFLDE